jgi:hypothetical protein
MLASLQVNCLVGRRHDPSALERTCKREPDRQWLNRMQDIVHDAVLAHGRGRCLNRKTKIVKAVGLD